MTFGDLLILLSLCFIIYEDFKYRAIHWGWLVLLAIGIGFWRPWTTWHLGINISFIVSQLILLSIYFSLKHKKITNILDNYLGLGDVLFFLVIALLFSPINFLLFFIFSLFSNLVFFLFYKYLSSPKINQTIPLAGAMAITLILVLFASEIFRHPIHLDYFTLKKIGSLTNFVF